MLARLVGREAGRSAEVRLKLYLTLLYLAREEGEWAAERKPAAAWAWLFGLDDPEKAGAQRVSNAIRALNKAGDVVADQAQGRESSVRPCLETGGGATWRSPVGKSGQPISDSDKYWQLDRAFWEQGWITVLSARGVAALCVLLDATWGWGSDYGDPQELESGGVVRQIKALRWFHLSEAQLQERYGLSRDFFDRGVKELESWHLVETRLRPTRTPGGQRQWHTSRARFYRELRVRLETLRAPMTDIARDRLPARVVHSAEDSTLRDDALAEFEQAKSTDNSAGPAKPGAKKGSVARAPRRSSRY